MLSFRDVIATTAPRSVILIRLIVGAVFLSEGIQKFLYSAELGAGRFIKIGIPFPHVMGPFVGVTEIVCGALILLGLLTRLAAIPLIINMLVAIALNKNSHSVKERLLGHGPREPHGLCHVAWIHLPADYRSGFVVHRCEAL